ncbi:MAG: hypothetical protein CFE44_06800 [Burkholderiales bacterium PBB4]|nr:MAG: hypothetical protein CFE44_06800 [Burkholderiales bacterium PBB4]
MRTFAVLAHGEVIGITHLESGNPLMGVAFGRFIPNESYAALRRATPLLAAGARSVTIQVPDGNVIPSKDTYVRDLSAEYGD